VNSNVNTKLILQYNDMWGKHLDPGPVGLPNGWSFTTDRTCFADAAVVIFHLPTMPPLWRFPLKRRGQQWVAWSMESDVNYRRQGNRWFMRFFDWTMTYRRDADIPVLYLNTAFASKLRQTPCPKEPGCQVAFFARNGADRCGRGAYVAELMRYIDVHAYGRFLRNRSLPEDLGSATKLQTIARYKFTIAIENSISPDYVTEKVFDALIAGSVPLYRGAANVDAFLPGDHCIIKVDDFRHPAELAAYLRRLDTDESAYNAYLEWKRRPFRPEFLSLLESQKVPPLVRLCRLLQPMHPYVDKPLAR
jgi:hypothetical protein